MPQAETPEPSGGSDVSALAYLALGAKKRVVKPSPHQQSLAASIIPKFVKVRKGVTFVRAVSSVGDQQLEVISDRLFLSSNRNPIQ